MVILESCYLDVYHDFRNFRLIRLFDFYARSLYFKVLEPGVVNLLSAYGVFIYCVYM